MMKNEYTQNCFLSGLKIQERTYTQEHVAPKSRIPNRLAQQPYNIRPAIGVFNNIKHARFYCQWMDEKYELCFKAYQTWNIRHADRELVRVALEDGMPERNPCEFCICASNSEYCINKLRLLEYIKSR